MSTPFENVVIIGVGLLGGSLGLALKKHGLAKNIVGIGRNRTSLEKAVACGTIDTAVMDSDLAGACADADLVVVSTPVQRAVSVVGDLGAIVAPGAVATDVASTKRDICAAATAAWAAPRRFVGSHPMAGSEKHGPEHASAELFRGHVCLVEQSDAVAPDARARIVALWQGIGARVVPVDAADHDDILARTSHVPHVLAAALAQLAARKGDVHDFLGNGFRDTTRIAASRPEVWRDICLSNQNAVLHALEEYQQILEALHDALADGDADAVEQFFADGNAARARAFGREQ